MNIHEAAITALRNNLQFIYRHDAEAVWDIRIDLGVDAPRWAVRYCGLGSDYEWHEREDFVLTQDDLTSIEWRTSDNEVAP